MIPGSYRINTLVVCSRPLLNGVSLASMLCTYYVVVRNTDPENTTNHGRWPFLSLAITLKNMKESSPPSHSPEIEKSLVGKVPDDAAEGVTTLIDETVTFRIRHE